ncbi:MAG: fumarylacetoacetate hydrolase family protein [Neisseriaceae bacterium]|jgi:2-keto-4-pentenoate hydratase/2-oxohepta-3-ene-1,7-dioic acid hydratase in catechol pathway
MDKIVCFGKNYQDHILELGDKPVNEPVIFLKPYSVLKQCNNWGESINVILTEDETHYECELVIKLKNGGYNMSQIEAQQSIQAYTIGLDMTLRKKQVQLKFEGHPWAIAKVFPDSAIIGPWIETNDLNFLELPFSFYLDGVIKQSSYGNEMLFKPIELIQYASRFFPLCAGDILFTGTPSGVGAVSNNSEGKLILGDHIYQVNWVKNS